MLTGMNGTDISKRALRLGRMLDRLQEGTYSLELKKGEKTWAVVVKSIEDDQQQQTIRRVEINDEGITRQENRLAESE